MTVKIVFAVWLEIAADAIVECTMTRGIMTVSERHRKIVGLQTLQLRCWIVCVLIQSLLCILNPFMLSTYNQWFRMNISICVEHAP